MKVDVLAVGEILIDFTPAGRNELGSELFACNPGGAPANVLAMNAKLGGRTAFIGKVGDDPFGALLRKTLVDIGIDVSGLAVDPEIPTTLAIVQLDERGDRSFSFYRKPGADIMLRPEDIPAGLIESCNIFHFGSVSLTDEPCRSTVFGAVERARALGKVISFDPNYRAPLWADEETAREEMLRGAALADILKVSEEELTLLTGETDIEAGAEKLMELGVSLLLVSLGPGGAYYRSAVCSGRLATYDVATVDTTGAGDAFLGAVHYKLRGKSAADLRELSDDELRCMVDFANAAGSLTTTKGGAVPAMPELREIDRCMCSIELLGTVAQNVKS